MKFYKELTQNSVILTLPEPEYVYIQLTQHVGAPAQALVKKGDKVFLGQLIGSTDAFVTADIHASVSGVVVDLIKTSNAQGMWVDTLKIKNDFQNTLAPEIKPKKKLTELNIEELRTLVREAGLVGMGRAGFPTHVKISPPEDKQVDTLILNATECEPYLTADYRLLIEKPEEVLFGLQALAKAVNAKNIFIGIEKNKSAAVKILKQYLTKHHLQIKIKVLPTVYPMGAEKVLVKKMTGRTIDNKGIALDVGVVVVNVGTAYQLAETLISGLPLIKRVVTVSGAFANPGNYLVKIGTPYRDIVKLPADFSENKYKIISGGPMAGFSVYDLAIPVVKGTTGLILLTDHPQTESNCIRCGRCVDLCPLGLEPYQYKGLDECMECGLCAYACPAKLFLVQKARVYKQRLKQAYSYK